MSASVTAAPPSLPFHVPNSIVYTSSNSNNTKPVNSAPSADVLSVRTETSPKRDQRFLGIGLGLGLGLGYGGYGYGGFGYGGPCSSWRYAALGFPYGYGGCYGGYGFPYYGGIYG